MLMDPLPGQQQHAGLHHVVLWPHQKVTKPKARIKPALPEKSGMDGGVLVAQFVSTNQSAQNQILVWYNYTRFK